MNPEFIPFRFPERSLARLAITHVNLVPMDSNRVIPDCTVVIEGERIVTIAPSSQIDPAAQGVERIVNGSGKYLMPGLADMYTHYREPSEAPLYLAHGITAARTSGNPFQIAMEHAAARGEFPSPRMFVVTPGIDGVGPTGRTDMPHGIPLTRPEDAAALVEKYVARGYHEIMPFSLLAPDVLEALSRAAAERNVRVAGNCPNGLSWEEAAQAGMSGFQQLHIVARDHMLDEYAATQTYWDRFDPAPGTKLDFDKIRRLGGFLAKHQVWSLPTVAFHQRASQPVEISLAHPSLRYVHQSTINDWETTIIRWGHRGRVDAEEWRRLARIRAEAFHRIVSIFHQEGAPQLTCTDGVNPYNVQGDTLHQEIENFVSAGMSDYDALRCATSEAARYMNESKDWGTLEVGKRANMILVNANPLRDVRATRDIETVFVNGYCLDRACLDDLLRQRADLAKSAPPIASTQLANAPPEGAVEREGVWLERICDADFGRIAYRHTRLANGELLVEERHAGAEPRRQALRRSSRLLLDKDLCVLSGAYDLETAVGIEHGDLARTPDGYRLTFRAIDGGVTESVLVSDPLPPSDHMTLSTMPTLIATLGEAGLTTLDADASLGTADLAIAAAQDEEPQSWQVQTARPGQKATQTYRLDPGGKLAGLQETTILLWPRQVIVEK